MDWEKFREQLEAGKSHLTDELSNLGVRDEASRGDWDATRGDNPSAGNASDEVADELEEMSERKAAEATLERQLAKVERALGKIATGGYGNCEISGEPIETDRLEANPAARTCKAHMEEEDNLPL